MWVIYYKPHCPYSKEALELLKKNKEEFKAYDVTNNKVQVVKKLQRQNKLSSMTAPESVTVPICFRKGNYIGGCQELKCILDKKLCNLFKK